MKKFWNLNAFLMSLFATMLLLGTWKFGSHVVIALIINDPVPYTESCNLPNRPTRALCHKTVAIAQFHELRRYVLSKYSRVLAEGPQLVKGLQMMIDAGIQPQEIGMDPASLRHELEQARRYYQKDRIFL